MLRKGKWKEPYSSQTSALSFKKTYVSLPHRKNRRFHRKKFTPKLILLIFGTELKLKAMKYKKPLIIFGIILLVSGCSDFFMICSLNPFFLEKNVTIVPEIEGNWQATTIKQKPENENDKEEAKVWELADTTYVWQIKRFISEEKMKAKSGKDSTVIKPQNYYVASLIGNNPDSAQYHFQLTLFRVNGALYGDFSPREVKAVSNSRMARENYLTVHTLAQIKVQNGQLFVSWLGNEYMQEMIEKKRVRIQYRYVKGAGRLLLTASSNDLTDMLERYAHQKRFIDWENQPAMMKLNRIN